MGRKQERFKKCIEKNTIQEYLRIQNKFYPELFYLTHHVTLNKYLEKLKLVELKKIQQVIVYKMIRRTS